MENAKQKNNHKTLKKVFTAIFLTVCLLLMVNLADIFSSLITVGGFGFTNDNMVFAETKYYAVCTSSHASKLSANESCDTIQMQGGAGYVFAGDDVFYVIASIYESEGDAEKVLNNIKESKPNASIQTITIKGISFNNNLSAQEKAVINESIAIYKKTYKQLYDISVSLDTAVLTEVNARLKLNEISSSITTTLGNFNTLFSSNLTTGLMQIQTNLNNLNEQIKLLIDSTSRPPFSALIKETYCKTVFLNKSLAESLAG
ncbi:MAG: hypothetical protein E7378_02425 [Clostridiales bacterium]|nr:hypothetical protein [Clostridiales bacterium]